VRVVVVDSVELEAKHLTRTLCDFGYSNVVHRRDAATAMTEIASNQPTIVITDVALADESGLELVRRVRARDSEEYVYVIGLSAQAAANRIRKAFDAGVDDFIAKPHRPEELALRVRAGERVVNLESRLRRRGKELETALRRIDVAAAQRALAKAEAAPADAGSIAAGDVDGLVASAPWRALGDVFSATIGEFLQLPFEITAPLEERQEWFVADVLLAEPSKQMEIGLTILVDRPSACRMGVHLLGSDDDLESVQALVLEIANVLMGAVKTSFARSGYAFTGGLPTSVDLAEAKRVFEGLPTRRRFAFSSGDIEIEACVRTKSKQNVRIRAKDLKEGMIISEDVHDARGTLLMRGGIRLTETAADRLARLAPDLTVAVSDPGG
jgi:CheY-like chemotaxis protein